MGRRKSDRHEDGSKSQGEQVSQILREVIATFPDDSIINPVIVADRGFHKLDPNGDSPVLVRYGCTMELRQMAREILREVYVEPASETESLFEELPARIPKMQTEGGDGEEGYVPRLQASLEERRAYSALLGRHIMARIKRKDAFDAETEELIRSGHFADGADE